MASIPCALIVLLICLSQDHTGVRGNPYIVFSSAGGAAILPCYNVVGPGCSSTRWTNSTGTQFVEYGRIQPAVATHRVSLLPNCSLHITDVTPEDAGDYTCQHYLRESRSQPGVVVRLTVLYVFAFPRETEMEAGSIVTLHCILNPSDWCHAEGRDYEIHLSVLDEGGKDLKNNSNDRARCKIQLTVELRDPNTTHTQRTWRCQMTARGHVRTSATYTIRVKVPDSTPASLTDSSVPDSTASSTTSSGETPSGETPTPWTTNQGPDGWGGGDGGWH
ncbi:uncharacterized protein LOC143110116 [Alosa pseudoharengus]|uniref:uncharacterized protein LOC143110116 n=1 Tax=Alosa pseudoharengus TaxID=34774 RepID=UPI003F8AA61E